MQADTTRPYALAPLTPYGVTITPDAAPASAVPPSAISIDWLKAEVAKNKIVVLRGFQSLEKDDFVNFAKSLGPLLEWNFGFVLELTEHQDPKNYLFSKGNVPYHWDGAFAAQVPAYQVFQCLEAPDPGTGGETVFCDTLAVLDRADPAERAEWERMEIVYRTEKKAHYGGEKRQPLIDRHPLTGEKTIRFAEPLNEESIKLNPLFLEIYRDGNQLSDAASADFLNGFIPRLYGEPVVFRQSWNDGDFVITDNHALLHGRDPYHRSSRRYIQRIHVI